MAVIFPPYSGGGGGGGVSSVNGDAGPAVVLDAADVGAMDADAIAVTTTANRVYGTGSDGSPTVYVISTGTTTGAIAQRGTNGVLPVGTPTATNHATTKAYVDAINTALDTRLDALESGAIMGDGTVTDMVARTQAEYDAIVTKDPTTHYLIDG